VYEAKRLSLDSAKARAQLGWQPVWAAPEAVRRTAAWYREYDRTPARAAELVDHELEAYQQAAREAGLPWAQSEDNVRT
jgi:CDP-glucose 4,6-dehydratase